MWDLSLAAECQLTSCALGGSGAGDGTVTDPTWMEMDFLMKKPEVSLPVRVVWPSKVLTKPAWFPLWDPNERDLRHLHCEAKDISV